MFQSKLLSETKLIQDPFFADKGPKEYDLFSSHCCQTIHNRSPDPYLWICYHWIPLQRNAWCSEILLQNGSQSVAIFSVLVPKKQNKGPIRLCNPDLNPKFKKKNS